jgi:hypothetical protein
MSVVESKSLLAKLLAEENISVQHRKTQTAYFNVKERVLVCPIMKDMPPELYDLLMGHEVGHALYTPAEGWHNVLSEDKRPNFKSFLNIVEDARIERFIKNKFPGIRPSFFKGYKNLLQRDFFGINNLEVQSLPLIDRVNLHFKLGAAVSVSFDSEEMPLVDMVDQAETWDDVVAAANALYEYAQQNPETPESSTSQNDEFDFSNDESEDFEASSSLDSDFDDSIEQDQNTDADPSDEDMDGIKGSSGESMYQPAPESITDRNFRQKERELVDDSCAPSVYVDLPTLNMTKRIVPYKVLLSHLENNLVSPGSNINPSEFSMSVAQFNEKNSRYINYLIKEFELRKNASQFSRAAVNKTGQLDMQKISKYRLSEDLFKRVTIVPQGKSHGLVLFLDLSSSMSRIFADTIEQLLIVTTFCRKANIPFLVYGFSDRPESFKQFCAEDATQLPLQSPVQNEIYMGPDNIYFHLKEYLSSSMSKLEYTNAMRNLLIMGGMITRGYKELMAQSERLYGTPLNAAIVASSQIVNNFRKVNKLEVVSTMFLTDGESNRESECYYSNNEGNIANFRSQVGYTFNYNTIITDKVSRNSVTITHNDILTKAYLLLAKKSTGANYIGFYIGQRGYTIGSLVREVVSTYLSNSPLTDAQKNEIRKQKFCALQGTGFDVYYIVTGDDIRVKETSISVSTDATKTDIRRAFMNTMNSRALNRVFLSRFCNTLCSQL